MCWLKSRRGGGGSIAILNSSTESREEGGDAVMLNESAKTRREGTVVPNRNAVSI